MGKFILVVVVVAAVIYLVTRLIETRGRLFGGSGGNGGSGGLSVRRPGGPRPGGPQRPRGPMGPDDDPDFLRDLNRKRPRKDPED